MGKLFSIIVNVIKFLLQCQIPILMVFLQTFKKFIKQCQMTMRFFQKV